MRNTLSEISTAYKHLLANGAWFHLLWLWALIIFILQWAFAYEQLVAVWGLGPEFIPQFLIDGYIAFFANIVDIIPITIVLIALFQALSILAIRKIDERLSTSQKSSYGLSLVASGCVACGTSVLTPFLSGLSFATASVAGNVISSVLLILALALAVISWWQAGVRLATVQGAQ